MRSSSISTPPPPFLTQQQPVISVDTKKELVGDFKTTGREWQPTGTPEPVRVHDFAIPELGKAVPYGVYDIAANAGWVNLGINHDTAAFAVESIRRWWHALGAARYLRDGTVLPDEIVAEWRGLDALYHGAVGWPGVAPGVIERGFLLKMRFDLDLFINLRPFHKLLTAAATSLGAL